MTITIVIPTYDRPVKLARALHSCLKQTSAPTEVIVVDNGRNPETSRQVDDALATKPLFPIRYIQSEPFSLRKALSRGIKEAAMEWTILLDDDDYLVPERIENDQRIIAEVTRDTILLVQDFARIDYRNDLVWLHRMAHKELGLVQALTLDSFPPPPAGTWRTSKLKAHHSFDLPEGWMTDFELYSSLLPHGGLLKTKLVGYVMDDTRTTDRLTASADKYISMVDLHQERFHTTAKENNIDSAAIARRLAQQKAFFAAKNTGFRALSGKDSQLARQYPIETIKGLLAPLRALFSRMFAAYLPEMRGSKTYKLAQLRKFNPGLCALIERSRLQNDGCV